ncbi:MAG: sigma-70 family RNA polymerase sigma factor, partial [Nitrosarchaeum sp.]|nr:sigma-70 family RNA polymerase sigma factor [Nitrosarchaeum sp.]
LVYMTSDDNQFIALYDDYAERIFKYCYFRVSSKEEAEDITAKVFLKTWEYLEKGNVIEHPKTFLYKSANNLVIDFYRTTKRNREWSLDDPEHELDIPADNDLIKDLDTQILINEVRDYIVALPEKYQLIVILRYVDDLTIPEIADVTDLSENNISVRLHRAIEKLKQQMLDNKKKI